MFPGSIIRHEKHINENLHFQEVEDDSRRLESSVFYVFTGAFWGKSFLDSISEVVVCQKTTVG